MKNLKSKLYNEVEMKIIREVNEYCYKQNKRKVSNKVSDRLYWEVSGQVFEKVHHCIWREIDEKF